MERVVFGSCHYYLFWGKERNFFQKKVAIFIKWYSMYTEIAVNDKIIW